MHLYLWRDVLRDWTPGMAFAIAASPAEARGLLLATGEFWDAQGLAAEPEVHELDKPFAALCHGGG